MSARRVIGLATALSGALLAPGVARGEGAVRPRFVIVVDTSGSMGMSATNQRTHGDGSEDHPGCDIDGNGKYDDSRMYQAKAALQETLHAFGSAEFALARYHQYEFGQTCSTVGNCPTGQGANACIGGRCAYDTLTRGGGTSSDYDECAGGGNGCIRCANPASDPTHVWYFGGSCCAPGDPRSGGFGTSGDVLVGFPAAGTSNVPEMITWIDGKEDFPTGTNKELRASASTPIGGALNAVRDWLVNDNSPIGPGGGILNRDPLAGCRAYNVILVTDGLEQQNCIQTCGIAAGPAAQLLLHACTNGGLWSAARNRCEVNGDPANTREIRVKTYVIGFGVNGPGINAIAAAGGTGTALEANNAAELTARLSDIIAASIQAEKCDCQDNTCDGLVDESFPQKGSACSVGVGRCKRAGTYGCKADGSGVACAGTPSGICPAGELQPGTPVPEVCGAAPGCDAPTAEDCADDDCNGIPDENMSCMCQGKPEVCNGADDDCNGKVDDVPPVPCGLAIGECRPGLTACEDDGQGGKRTACLGGTQPSPELCDGLDNDCDGVTDGFGVACYPANMPGCTLAGNPLTCGAAPQPQWSCLGACQTGLVSCSAGACGACLGAITPSTEVACDGADNDCDGQVDEGFDLGGGCGPGMSGVGACRPGILTCDGVHLRCMGGQGPSDETCNGVDDDCNGTVDDLTERCGVLRGECRLGLMVCAGTQPICRQEQGPMPERCDGKDNDCDGRVDNDPTDPDLGMVCGSTVGICRPGITRCSGGAKFCDGGILPEIEICNGLDDNCDGQVDNGLQPPGPCPPPGLPPGSPVVGECRPGMNTCARGPAGAAWTCAGGTGPAAEVCNGRDDDCDGQVDDGAPCPAGGGCADGECVPACGRGEFQCPADRVCTDGLCVYSECAKRSCPAELSCDPRLGCVDRCAGLACPEGTACDHGTCTSCFVTGCPPGQICRGASCEADPCLGKSCPAGSYCNAGACTRDCERVRCPAGQSCQRGDCGSDPCAGRVCPVGQICDAGGRCTADPCGLIQCLRGQVCVPQRAACLPDPCPAIACPASHLCRVMPDGRGECVDRRRLVQRVVVSAAGGGCALGRGAPEGPGFVLLAFAWYLTLLRLRYKNLIGTMNLPASFAFDLGELRYRCEVSAEGEFILYADQIERGRGTVTQRADGHWHVAKRTVSIGNPIAFQIEAQLNAEP